MSFRKSRSRSPMAMSDKTKKGFTDEDYAAFLQPRPITGAETMSSFGISRSPMPMSAGLMDKTKKGFTEKKYAGFCQSLSDPIFHLKTSTASIAQRQNASTISKSLFDYYNLVVLYPALGARHPRYNYKLRNLFSNDIANTAATTTTTMQKLYFDGVNLATTASHKQTVASLCLLLKCQLKNHTVNQEMSLGTISNNLTPIFTTNKKVVDVVIFHESKVIVQLEVISNHDQSASQLKLAFGLVDQLRYIINHCEDQAAAAAISVSGFLVPLADTIGCVQLANCSWNFQSFQYDVIFSNLEMNDVVKTIQDVAQVQAKYVDDYSKNVNRCFSLPVAITADIKDRFGDVNLYQIKSGCSVVFISTAKCKIFKTSLDARENLKLVSYANKKYFEKSLAKDYVCFPIKAITDTDFTNSTFFEFPLLVPPISKQVARENIKDFCHLVSVAIEQLHLADLSHLDIRLENICFKDAGDGYVSNAVLIDLDRSKPAKDAFRMTTHHGDSTMYEVEDTPTSSTFTNEMLDWKQFGILLYNLVNELNDDYHATVIPESQSLTKGFLETLFYCGQFDRSLMNDWFATL